MLSVKLTSDGDLDMSLGYLQWTEGVASVLQHIRSRLNFATNTFYIFPKAGTPYKEYILGKKDLLLAVEKIKIVILKTPDVNDLLSFDYSFDSTTRILTASFSINSIYGDGEDIATIEI